MLELSRTCLAAATALLSLALAVNVIVVMTRSKASALAGKPAATPAGVGARRGNAISPLSPAEAEASGLAERPARPARGVAWASDRAVELALILLTVGLVVRSIATGHAPFSNQYEFAVSFAWGITAALVLFQWRYRIRALTLAVLPFAVVMLLYASTVGAEASPLMPALQNRWLLSLHVATAILSYGAAAVSSGAALLYLLRPHLKLPGLPSQELLDEVGYRGIVISFPLLTIMIILGAVWADIAWGRYWSWDPKETCALVTWLIYGAYLHARVSRGWRGNRSAVLLLVGFGAILFTYFGNLWLGGLHSYA